MDGFFVVVVFLFCFALFLLVNVFKKKDISSSEKYESAIQ